MIAMIANEMIAIKNIVFKLLYLTITMPYSHIRVHIFVLCLENI